MTTEEFRTAHKKKEGFAHLALGDEQKQAKLISRLIITHKDNKLVLYFSIQQWLVNET